MRIAGSALVAGLIMVTVAGCQSTGDPTIHLSGLELTPQAGWTSREPASSMRVAEFSINGDANDTSLIVYYFGAGTAGSTEANLDRWCTQFTQPDGRDSKDVAKIEMRHVNDLRMHTIDLGGTYVAETSPGSGERVDKPDYHLLAAIVDTDAGPYYVKMVGPAPTVQTWRGSYEAMLSTLRPGPLHDADDEVAHP